MVGLFIRSCLTHTPKTPHCHHQKMGGGGMRGERSPNYDTPKPPRQKKYRKRTHLILIKSYWEDYMLGNPPFFFPIFWEALSVFKLQYIFFHFWLCELNLTDASCSLSFQTIPGMESYSDAMQSIRGLSQMVRFPFLHCGRPGQVALKILLSTGILHVQVIESINKCDVDIRRELFSSILVGSLFLFLGNWNYDCFFSFFWH